MTRGARTLKLDELHAAYGQAPVLQGLSLLVQPGEIVSLLGRNGAGRSTALKAIMGLLPARGPISLGGQDLQGCPPFERARLGLGYVPEGRDIFPTLTVQQNLLLGQQSGRRASRWGFDDVYRQFPVLQARAQTPAGRLSGGEQQMLALSRTLMGDPDVILIDEPTEGLAPQLVEQVAGFLNTLRARGVAVLLVEQKLAMALEISDRCYLLGRGRIVFEGAPAALRERNDLRRKWLEV
jgi:branched-chain amino acid transport system ATP-binding protein